MKYITVLFQEGATKVFGLDRVDPTKKVYVIEGPIDAMFLPNALAMCGAFLNPKSLVELGISVDNLVYVFDNERRNKDIVRAMEHTLNTGASVCVWPDTLTAKDINDMIEDGLTSMKVKSIINSNTFSGLMAVIKINQWKLVR